MSAAIQQTGRGLRKKKKVFVFKAYRNVYNYIKSKNNVCAFFYCNLFKISVT